MYFNSVQLTVDSICLHSRLFGPIFHDFFFVPQNSVVQHNHALKRLTKRFFLLTVVNNNASSWQTHKFTLRLNADCCRSLFPVSFPAAQADGPQRVYNSAPKEDRAQALDEAPDATQVSDLVKGKWGKTNPVCVHWWFAITRLSCFVTESPPQRNLGALHPHWQEPAASVFGRIPHLLSSELGFFC